MRTARKLWVTLVIAGEFCVLAAIATGLAAVLLPHWIEYNVNASSFHHNRGLFQTCMGTFGSECLEISNPLTTFPTCKTSLAHNCTEDQESKFTWISRLRVANWAFLLAALGFEAVVSCLCVAYLAAVRYCIRQPSAQHAQACLVIAGYLLWLAAILTALGIVSVEGSFTFESITKDIGLNGLTGDIDEPAWQGLTESYGLSAILAWASAGLGMIASILWIVASFVQPPPHITSLVAEGTLKTFSSSSVPLCPLVPTHSTN